MKNNQIKLSPTTCVSLWKDERGMSTVEYVILLAVIVMGAVFTWNEIGGKVTRSLKASNTQIQTLPE